MDNPSIDCGNDLTRVVNHWMAGRSAHTTYQQIQAGGEGNGLLSKRDASYYKGSRFWTDGKAIYSYSTELMRNEWGMGCIRSPYYLGGRWSKTTSLHIKAIHRVTGDPMPEYKLVTTRSN